MLIGTLLPLYISFLMVGFVRILNELEDNKYSLGVGTFERCPRAVTKHLARKILLLPLFPIYVLPMGLCVLVKALAKLIKTAIK